MQHVGNQLVVMNLPQLDAPLIFWTVLLWVVVPETDGLVEQVSSRSATPATQLILIMGYMGMLFQIMFCHPKFWRSTSTVYGGASKT